MIALLGGFPVVVILSWVFDLDPDKLKLVVTPDAALEAALADDAVRRAAALGCRYSAGELGEKLVFDVQLNTQGLRDWQRRLQA